jgi:hypothetical protein
MIGPNYISNLLIRVLLVSVLVINAIAILSEDRFLARSKLLSSLPQRFHPMSCHRLQTVTRATDTLVATPSVFIQVENSTSPTMHSTIHARTAHSTRLT